MFSQEKRRLSGDRRAVFKYLKGCHVEEGAGLCRGADGCKQMGSGPNGRWLFSLPGLCKYAKGDLGDPPPLPSTPHTDWSRASQQGSFQKVALSPGLAFQVTPLG